MRPPDLTQPCPPSLGGSPSPVESLFPGGWCAGAGKVAQEWRNLGSLLADITYRCDLRGVT